MPISRRDQGGKTFRPGLRRLPEDRRLVGAPAPMSFLRTRRLLRFVEEQACHQTFSHQQAPVDPVLRTRRELAMVLRGPDVLAVMRDLRAVMRRSKLRLYG